MADVRIIPGSGSLSFTGSVNGDNLSIQYTGSALQFTTGSTNLIHISSSGFIGFGTSAPLPYNTASFVVNTDAFLGKGLTVGSDDFFNNATLRFYETDFNITANNVIQAYSLNVGSVPAISIRSINGNVGIGTDFYPSNAKLHVSGGNVWFNDTLTVGIDNYTGGGKVRFVVDNNFMYVGGDINTQTTTLFSQFGPVELQRNFNEEVFELNNGITYKRFGLPFFAATADTLTYNPTQGTFFITSQGSFQLGVQEGQKINVYSQYPGGIDITNWFTIDPQNGFDIFTGSAQLLGIKTNGNIEIGSSTNPNSVLSVTGSVDVSGSIFTTGSVLVTGSIQVSGSIYTNGTNIQALSIAYAIALG